MPEDLFPTAINRCHNLVRYFDGLPLLYIIKFGSNCNLHSQFIVRIYATLYAANSIECS